MLFFAPPPPPPVSYSQEVVPILAMRCNGCHGEAGRLSTRTHAALMAGGNLGKVVIPGDAENSLLAHFIEGRRGEARRMPAGGRPLSSAEIRTIRKWIDEGAIPDEPTLPQYSKVMENVRLPRDRILRVTCRVNSDAYLTVTIQDPSSGRVLLTRVASIKAEREEGDAGRPGELIPWDVRRELGWPERLNVRLMVEHAGKTVGEPEFTARLWNSRKY